MYSGKILSFNKMLGQLQDAGNTVTLSHYLDLLDKAGLISGIEKYSGSRIMQRGSSPKLSVYNNALVSSRLDTKLEDADSNHKLWGRIVESAAGTHLLNHSKSENYKLFYWRENNSEIDFVIEHKRKLVGIEIKSSETKNTKGISEFKKKYEPSKVYLVGEKSFPIEEFMKINPFEMI